MEFLAADLRIDFMRFRKVAFTASAVAMLAALVIVVVRGIPLGIDFTGGVEVQVRFQESTSIADVRAAMTELGLGISVQTFGDSDSREFLIRAPQLDTLEDTEVAIRIQDKLAAVFGAERFVIDRTDVVGPKVGSELREKGVLAVAFALIGILVYITFRFELAYALGAILALIHDVTLTLGVFSLLSKEFSLSTIAALLTIIGYSLNDTIIVFDRIRENRGRYRRMSLSELINKSINETLSRTILTSGTTLLTVLALWLLTQPGAVIHDFAFALLTGIVVGTYSSIFVASPLLILWAERKAAKN